MLLGLIGRALKSCRQISLMPTSIKTTNIQRRAFQSSFHQDRINLSTLCANVKATSSKLYLWKSLPISTSSITYKRQSDHQGDNEDGPQVPLKIQAPPKLPSRPTDQLVRAILASEDMKRVLGRELRKCGGMIDQINFSRMVYDSWNGYTEQIVLTHVGSKDRLLMLIHEAMKEDPVFRSYIENVLKDRLRSRPTTNIDLPGGKHLPWSLAGVSLLAAFFNYYFTALVLFIGAIYLALLY